MMEEIKQFERANYLPINMKVDPPHGKPPKFIKQFAMKNGIHLSNSSLAQSIVKNFDHDSIDEIEKVNPIFLRKD